MSLFGHSLSSCPTLSLLSQKTEPSHWQSYNYTSPQHLLPFITKTMAAVASQEPPPLAEPTETNAHDKEEHDHDADHDKEEHDNDAEDEEIENEVKGWDEGGKSDCGYGDGVHETLMSIGSSIHSLVGEPTETVMDAMNHIGNWFQEASYAARDLSKGTMNVGEETMQAVKSVVSGEEDEDKEGDDDKSQVEGGNEDEKLSPIKEDQSGNAE